MAHSEAINDASLILGSIIFGRMVYALEGGEPPNPLELGEFACLVLEALTIHTHVSYRDMDFY